MLFYAKIEQKNSKDDKSIIRLSTTKNLIDAIEISFDSPADVSSKDDKINNSIVIRGKLDDNNKLNSKLMAEWALTNSTSASAYRNLTLWILGSAESNKDNVIYRKIIFNYAFVVEYKENFVVGSDQNTYEIKLKQKRDKLSEIVIEANELKFDPAREGFEVEKKEGN